MRPPEFRINVISQSGARECRHREETVKQLGESIAASLCRATRALGRSPGFTAAVVTSLALGVGANTAVFALLRHALLRPLPYDHPDQLMVIGTAKRDGIDWDSMNYNVT